MKALRASQRYDRSSQEHLGTKSCWEASVHCVMRGVGRRNDVNDNQAGFRCGVLRRIRAPLVDPFDVSPDRARE